VLRSQTPGGVVQELYGLLLGHYPAFLIRGMASGCLACHRWSCTNHL
jgi:hypothetical protein